MDAATIVKRVRAQGGITRKQLAELADLAPSTIGRIEQGALDPRWGTLTRILESTGNRISGDTVVSAGDSTAIAAARSVLEPRMARDRGVAAVVTMRMASDASASWLKRWARVGWLSAGSGVEDAVSLAAAAGNAAKVTRRNVPRRIVEAASGWRSLVRQLGDAGIDYAVSGIVASREDRATAASANPLVYVADPALAVEKLGLSGSADGRGVLLIAPMGGELDEVEMDGGICFVPRVQALLDAFAGPGREPDKAEDALRALMAVGS